MTLPDRYVGCDVSKLWLDVFDPAQGRACRIPNTSADAARLAASIAATGGFVVFEATGVYDQALRAALHAAGVQNARINPTTARRFAQATGRKAKTDALDAVVLADLGARLRPAPDPAPCPHRERLGRLGLRRDQLVAARKDEIIRLKATGEPILIDSLKAHIAWLDGAISAIEREIAVLIAATELNDQARLLATAPGVGPVTAQVLLALMPELGASTPKRLAALAGLAPFNHDSGQLKGKRCISGGRRRVRSALFIAAMIAARLCPDLKAFADRIQAQGKPRKLALIAVARKLLTRLNAMLRDQTAYSTA
ncbi:MAG: IS110 family transposase [Oceanicaulis sp.]